jgi:hypothetical protein
MLLLGHLGIGRTLAIPFSKRLERRWIYLGTVLPDLIDKPLYYLLSWATGKQGLELGLISGSRTFGHTALFALLLSIGAWIKKSKFLAALSIGVGTHLILDSIADYFWVQSATLDSPLLWPLTGLQMPVMPFKNWVDHLQSKEHLTYLYPELIGTFLILIDYFKNPWFKPSRSRNKDKIHLVHKPILK